MRQQLVFQRSAGGFTVQHHFVHAIALQRALGQGRGQHQPAALAVGRAFGQHIVDLRAQRHRQRGRQRPRRGGPDRYGHFDVDRHAHAERLADGLRIACGVATSIAGDSFPGTRSRPRPAPSHSRNTSTPAWRRGPGGRWPRPWPARGSRWLRNRSSGSYGLSQSPVTPRRLKSTRWMLICSSANSRHFWRNSTASSLVPTLPHFFSTAISIGRPWQSQPGT